MTKGVYADFDMGLKASILHSLSAGLARRQAFNNWLTQNPRVSAAMGQDTPTMAFFTSAHRSDEVARACRARRHEVAADPAAREENLLRYKAYRKLSWIARSQPAPSNQ